MDNRQHSSDAALSAIASRDGAAFAVFYRRQVPVVLAYLLRETCDRETAADLAAEVFAAVLLAAGRYAAKGESATPWVLGIARNKVLMSFRRGRVEARARQRLGFEAVALDDCDLQRVEEVARGGAGRLVALVEELPADERFADAAGLARGHDGRRGQMGGAAGARTGGDARDHTANVVDTRLPAPDKRAMPAGTRAQAATRRPLAPASAPEGLIEPVSRARHTAWRSHRRSGPARR